MELRDLTPDEINKAKAKVPTFDPSKYQIDEAGNVYPRQDTTILEDVKDVAGRVARQAALALPSTIAGRLTGAAAGAGAGTIASALFPPAAPFVVPAAAIAGGIAGPIAMRHYVQEPIENYIIKKSPTSAISQQLLKSRADVANNPKTSFVGQLLTAPLAGGTLNVVNSIKQGFPRLAAQAGIMTGANLAAQKAGGGEISLPQALAGGVAGALTSGNPSSGYRSFERGLLSSLKVPEGAINEIAPNVPPETSALTSIPKRTVVPPHETSDYNPDFLLGTDVNNLSKLGRFEQTVANLRKQNIPLSPADLETLSREGSSSIGWDKAAQNLTRRKLQMMEGQAPPDERVKQQMEQNIAPGKQAAITGDVLKEAEAATKERLEQANESNEKQMQAIQNAKANQAAIEGTANYPTSGKSAAESAQNIVARQGEVKSVGKDISSLAAKRSAIERLEKLIDSLPEDTTNLQELHSMLAEMKGVFNTEKVEAAKRAETLLPGGKGLQEFPAEAGVEEPVPAVPESAKVTPMTSTGQPGAGVTAPLEASMKGGSTRNVVNTATSPKEVVKPSPVQDKNVIPENPSTIDEQMKLFREGKKQAVLLPPGTRLPNIQPGEQVTVTTKGTVIHGNDLNPKEVQVAARQNKLGDLLGYGIPAKPEGATTAVVVEKPSGVPVQEVLTTPETVKPVVEAAKAVAKPEDTITAKPAEQVIAQRLATPQVKRGDVITRGGQDYVVQQVGMKGMITARNKQGHVVNLRNEDLNRGIQSGEVTVNTPSEASAIESLLESSSNNELSKLARLAVRDDPNFYATVKAAPEKGIKEIDYFRSLPPEKQQEVINRYTAKLEEPSAPIKKGMKINLASSEGGFSLNPAKIAKAVYDKIAPDLEKLKKGFPLAPRFAKRAEEMVVRREQIVNPLLSHIIAAQKGLLPSERATIHDYLNDIADRGQSDIVLSPDLAARAKMLQDVVNITGQQKTTEGPWVIDFDQNGNQFLRPAEMRPGFVPISGLKPEISKILKSGTAEQIAPIVERMVQWIAEKKGVDPETALKIFNAKYQGGSFTTRQTFTPEFQGLRYAEGVGVPPEYRENIFNSLKHYVNRHGTDLAYHQTMETDPVIGKALGLENNGRGEAYPELPEGKNVVSGELNNDLTKAVFRDYLGYSLPEAQATERWHRLANTLMIQHFTEAKNILTTYPILNEILKPTEQHYIAVALKDLFTPGTKENAIQAGAVKPARNIASQTALDVSDSVNQLADIVQKGTGLEALNTAQRVFNYAIGKRLATKRLNEGDTAFFDKWGPHNWQEWDQEQLKDYVAARVSKYVVGRGNFEGLPSSLTHGSGNLWKPLFSLARWSVDRFNGWKTNVFDEAKKGNIGPLISSIAGSVLTAGAVNWLTKQITQRKPSELTWEEYLKLGGKDTANTVFSKLAAASYGGILSDIALAGVKLANGEAPRGFNNLMFKTAENVITRLGQYAGGLQEGTADGISGLGTLIGTILRDNIQAVRLLTPKPDNTGMREQVLAERLGYAPSKFSMDSYKLPSPWSAAQLYQNENLPALAALKTARLEEHRQQPTPTSAMKNFGVYKFIEETQGKEARDAAIRRDAAQTAKNASTFARAGFAPLTTNR